MASARQTWWIRVGISLVIAAALLGALSGQIDLIPARFDLPLWVLPAYLGTLLLYFLTRAARWHFLLAPLGAKSLRLTTLTALAGFMWIILLPFRLGELARPLFVAQKTDIAISQALGSVGLERVVDGLFVCTLFFALVSSRTEQMAMASEELSVLVTIGTVAAGLFLAALVLLLGMARWPHAFGRLVAAPLRAVAPGLAERLRVVAGGIAEGLAALPSPRPFLLFLLGTALYWMVNVVAMWLLARGVGLPLDPLQVAAVMSVLAIALLIPGGPAQLGPYQGGVFVGLALFVEPDVLGDQGSAYMFYIYTGQLVVGVALGLWAHRKLQLDWRALLPGRAQQEPAS